MKRKLLTNTFLALTLAFTVACAFEVREDVDTIYHNGRGWVSDVTYTEEGDGSSAQGFIVSKGVRHEGKSFRISSGFHDSREDAYKAFKREIDKTLTRIPKSKRQEFIDFNSLDGPSSGDGEETALGD